LTFGNEGCEYLSVEFVLIRLFRLHSQPQDMQDRKQL